MVKFLDVHRQCPGFDLCPEAISYHESLSLGDTDTPRKPQLLYFTVIHQSRKVVYHRSWRRQWYVPSFTWRILNQTLEFIEWSCLFSMLLRVMMLLNSSLQITFSSLSVLQASHQVSLRSFWLLLINLLKAFPVLPNASTQPSTC